MVVLYVYNGHLSCLLPQHGPGKKRERPIVLAPWQEALVAAAPWALLKGLIRSDGCVFVIRTGKSGPPTSATCSSRRAGVRVYQRRSVALRSEHVGDKC
jgi:hypothetical protein